jgi:hypothetical protein
LTKTIDTLVEDIQEVLLNGVEKVPNEIAEEFGRNMAELLVSRMSNREDKSGLRMSNIGTPCDRKLWLQINHAEDKEELDASSILKFFYGDLIEETLLALAQLAGHSVTGRQSELRIGGIVGHRDAVVDGTTVDVKSASTFSFGKFKRGDLLSDDPFGYVDQLQSYIKAGQEDELVTDKLRGAFLVADKTLGHLTLDIHKRDESRDLTKEFERKQDMVKGHMIPARTYNPVPDGASGNMKLGTFCSYCNVKHICHPGLRTFAYSNGPKYLTVVKRQPEVPEVHNDEI